MDEPLRVYQHFREVFGGYTGPRARRRAERPAAASIPFSGGRDPQGLGDALEGLTRTLGWNSTLDQHELLASWAEIAGDDTAAHSEPLSIEAGVLTVRCESTAWATQLRLMRTEIVTRIVSRFPNAAIESIRFQGPDAPSWKRGPRSVPGRGPRDTYG